MSLPTKVPVACVSCGTVFIKHRSTLWHMTPGVPLHCSKACQYAAATVALTCEGCRVGYTKLRCEVEKAKRKGFLRTFCTKACFLAYESRQAAARVSTATVGPPERLITDTEIRTDTGRRRYYDAETAALSDGVNRKRACVSCGVIRKSKSVMCRDCWMQARASTYLTLNCTQCGSGFTKMRAEHEKALRGGQTNAFCGSTCHHQWMREHPSGICAHCGGPMKIEGAKRYCSHACRVAVRNARRAQKAKPCPQCGKVFEYSSVRRMYCDRICADMAHADRMVGTGNSRYKDGTSYGLWFREMRPLIMERDGSQCRVCATPDRQIPTGRKCGQPMKSILVQHHINEQPWDNRAKNLILLCQSCHMVHHKSKPTPYPWFASYAESATRSMTSKWTATVTSLQNRFSSTTASSSMTP